MMIGTGTKLARYEIRTKIGEGGMGEVYLAEDTRLHRKVALKILPADLASQRDRMRRFEQEATAAAALNHPNIAHIYEIGEADGLNFIAMEFIDGQTLRECIYGGQTVLPRLLRHLQHVAEGLTKAHAAGIVHRDLKPENIMITRDGYAKILDFGVAKLIEPVSQKPDREGGPVPNEAATAILEQHSTPGMVLGTAGYMSPEQALGKTNQTDQRSDIFSFGCIVYEAVTGHKAFKGKDPIDTLNRIIREPVTPVVELRPDAPNHLQRIVRRCLAKDPDDRYQTIKDVAIELRELRRELAASAGLDITTVPPPAVTTSGGFPAGARSSSLASTSTPASSAEYIVTGIRRHRMVTAVAALTLLMLVGIIMAVYLRTRKSEAAIDSIAVLPFVNNSGDTSAEYLSDGIAETLINSLSQVQQLRVVARSTAFRYKGKEVDPQAIGRDLNVRAVLMGRVRQMGESLNIQVDLVDTRTGAQLWGQEYDRKVSDMLSMKQDIAREVTEKLRLGLTGEQNRQVTSRDASNGEAYQLYLKGRFYWNKRTGEAIRRAIDFFNQAIEKDPNYALGYAGLADAYLLLPAHSQGAPQETIPKAKAAARKALELDETLAEAHTSLAFTLFVYDWNWTESTREFQRAIELNKNYATAHHWYGNVNLARLGRFDEAIAEMKTAQELDPFSLAINADVGETYLYARQYDKAIHELQKTLEMDQSFYRAHYLLGETFVAKGSLQDAIAEYQKARQLNDDPAVLALLGQALALSGERVEALKTIDQLKEIAKQRYVPSLSVAFVYAGLGDSDQAMNWLEKGYQTHEPGMARLKVDPVFDNLRGDPRFAELIRRVGVTAVENRKL